MNNVKTIRAFLASPGDTAEERLIVSDVVNDLNRNEGRESAFFVDLWIWEKDSFPSIGEDAQDVINNQVYDYEIFIGIMNQRFGTPTTRANSGTEEEFDRAYEKYLESAGKLQLLFYFKNPTVKLMEIDLHQAGLVTRFRKRLQSLGVLYGTFEEAAQLRHEFRNHLRKAVRVITHHSAVLNVKKEVVQESIIRSLPDWLPESQRIHPQWASYREVNLEGSRDFELSGRFTSESSYYRFGFKMMKDDGRIFGDGCIQSQDNNLVAHVGKNGRGEACAFLTTYYNGVREALNHELDSGGDCFDFRVQVSSCVVRVFVDEACFYERYVPSDLISRLVLMAWGDENVYAAKFQNITLNIRS